MARPRRSADHYRLAIEAVLKTGISEDGAAQKFGVRERTLHRRLRSYRHKHPAQPTIEDLDLPEPRRAGRPESLNLWNETLGLAGSFYRRTKRR